MNEKLHELRFNNEKAICFFSKLAAYTVGPMELKELLDENNVKLIDVRCVEDYQTAHIPTAISIPKSELSNNLDKLSKDQINIVYCYNEQCRLAVKAALLLAEYGYPVMMLLGGFQTWVEDFRFATESRQ